MKKPCSSGAPYQISDPTGAMSAVLIVLVQKIWDAGYLDRRTHVCFFAHPSVAYQRQQQLHASSWALNQADRRASSALSTQSDVLLSMFLLAPIMARIPLAALAGVLMITAHPNERMGRHPLYLRQTFQDRYHLFFAATSSFNEAFVNLGDTHAVVLSMRGVP